jgi:ribosome recycling factor
MSITEIEKEAQDKMDHTISFFKEELKSIRTGRASLSILDNVGVDAYGSGPMPINQLGTLSTPDARTIVIEPWDKSVVPLIEKAILTSDLGLNPVNDGYVIRIPIPALTEERRKDFVKVIKAKAEEARVAVRNIRRDANDKLKTAQKASEISEDEEKRAHDDIQKFTDKHIVKVNEISAQKEKEIMEV